MKCVVLGGAGFLGGHLVHRLLEDGHEVTIVDDLSTPRRVLAEDAYRVPFVLHDIVRPFPTETRAYSLGCVDRVYNLACPASPALYQRDPETTILTCVVGTQNALRFAELFGARVLLASTSEVYGDPDVHPQRESYCGNVSTTGPRACYDEGKRCAEAMMTAFAGRVDTRIARIFNTYGPGMDRFDGRLVPELLRCAMRGLPLPIYGDGQQTRSLCYVEDLVDGLVRVMESDVTAPVNLGNPEEYSVKAIAQLVAGAVGVPLELEHRPARQDDPHVRRPDITRARSLGFDPKVGVVEGIARTVRHALEEVPS